MISSDRQGEFTPKSGELSKELSFNYSREQRERYDIKINKLKYVSFHDFLISLELDHHMNGVVQRDKHEIGNYIYYLEVELKQANSEKTSTKWTLKKRFVDFFQLDKELNKELVDSGKLMKSMVPPFSQFYHLRGEGAPDLFIEAAEKYLTQLMESQEIRENSVLLYEFIELSLLPVTTGPQKLKEGYLKKRSGGRFKKNKFRLYCSVLFSNWQQRWFLLTEEGIIYAINSTSTKVREMLLFDQSFQIEYGRHDTGTKTGITLRTPSRRLNLQASNLFEALDWIGEIKRTAKASPYTKINRYLSYAPVREPTTYCKWYVDGEGYFEDLYETLMSAKKEIFITDWWLSPELHLKRPVENPEAETRLDLTLAKIANSGVKVFIIVYHEVKMVMYNDSEHTKKTLESLSPNITVLKHPSEPFFSWSHHEKLVVVDQQIGFVGGFDLCFGRMDTSAHPLFDPAMMQGTGETFPGQDYANPRLVDFKNVREHDTPLIDKNSAPRMPFHDAMIKLIGPVVADLSRHFIQYWNHVQVDVYGKDEETPLPLNSIQPPVDEEEEDNNASMKLKKAFRKIFGMRSIANAMRNNPPKVQQEEHFMGPAAGHALAFRRAQSTLPPIQERFGTANRISSTNSIEPKDDLKIICHNKKNVEPSGDKHSTQASSISSVVDHWKSNTKPKKFIKSGPATEKDDVLLTGKNEETKEPRAATKIIEGVKDMIAEENPNPLVRRTSTRIPNKRQVRTMNQIGTVRNRNPQDDKQYQDKYADLLKKIREKEKEYDHEVQISQSKVSGRGSKAPEHKSHFSKFFDLGKHNKEDEEKRKINKQFSDQFYEKNMLQLFFSNENKLPKGTCACQMLRSASKWSLGLNSNDGIENSIQNAYIEIIQNSKSFLYIENQFFMSGTAGKVIQNEVAQALIYRIEKAFHRQEKYRVLVFLPLVPAFEGEVIDSKAALLRIQMHWQYMTICRGGESIYEQLRNKGIPPEEYIQFYSLRTHARMPDGQPATEMVYIHSKILIADDDILLIGSANINDRSLQGSRDSELAIVIEDSKKIKSVMDDQEVEVGEFACTFRRRLLAEHLGMSEEEVEDPLNDDFMDRMEQITQTNTDVYREVFACYPDDNVKALDDLEEFTKLADISKYDELIPKVQGNVVWFPLDFLSNEQLKPPISTMEYYIPDQTFV